MIGARFDVCVVGAGLVGLSVARALTESHPGISVVILDKESRVAAHQSSHNSGVVHSGLYYRPGSLKARLCVEGRDAVYRLSEEASVPVRRSGKLVIATDVRQLDALDELERRGRANGLRGLDRIGGGDIAGFEPHAIGVSALHVPEAGVVDYPALAGHLADRLRRGGTEIALGAPVTEILPESDGVRVGRDDDVLWCKALINCAGLHSDRVARLAGVVPPVQIVPFRGEYYRLSPDAADLVRALIYPVPDPRFPFLGVHFTRRIDGTVEVGPNAVPAIGREHYRGASRNWRDFRESLGYRGFRRLARRYWREGLRELRSSRSKRRYARLARALVPAVGSGDLRDGGAGVRAQAVAPDGSLVDDFVIETAGPTIHVLNAPSPGATASLAIGKHVASLAGSVLDR